MNFLAIVSYGCLICFGGLGFQRLYPSKLQVNISAEELGARDKSPYNTYILNDISSSSVAHIIR